MEKITLPDEEIDYPNTFVKKARKMRREIDPCPYFTYGQQWKN
jgi:hypothetical protein